MQCGVVLQCAPPLRRISELTQNLVRPTVVSSVRLQDYCSLAHPFIVLTLCMCQRDIPTVCFTRPMGELILMNCSSRRRCVTGCVCVCVCVVVVAVTTVVNVVFAVITVAIVAVVQLLLFSIRF